MIAPRDGWTIGELARMTGFQPSAIRFYESAGLLPTSGPAQGPRRYDAAAVRHLSVIDLGRRAGFSLEEIRTRLLGFTTPAPPPKKGA
jgi:MerR family transcriptional regulator, redox-sensitive transcriptional activator SoxR